MEILIKNSTKEGKYCKTCYDAGFNKGKSDYETMKKEMLHYKDECMKLAAKLRQSPRGLASVPMGIRTDVLHEASKQTQEVEK